MWVVDIILTMCLAALTVGCAMTWRDLEDRVEDLRNASGLERSRSPNLQKRLHDLEERFRQSEGAQK